MCPVCLANAMMVAGGVTSTGGLAAIAMKRLGMKKDPDNSKGEDKDGNEHGN